MNEIYTNRKIKLVICILKDIQNFYKKQRFRKCDTGTTILNTLKKITGQEHVIFQGLLIKLSLSRCWNPIPFLLRG